MKIQSRSLCQYLRILTTSMLMYLVLATSYAADPNQVPLVEITGPLDGSTYVPPATIVLSADAWDRDGSIAKVEFYRNGTKMGEVSSNPYIYVWTNVGAGTYTITAKAIDNVGASMTSLPITIIVTSGGGSSGDSDGDGLQDAWEVQYFGAISDPRALPNLDVDGDGITNVGEESAGTDPTDSTSRLAITSQKYIGSASFEITWFSVSGKTYEIDSSTDLVNWTNEASVTASGSQMVWVDTAVSDVRKYYRIRSS